MEATACWGTVLKGYAATIGPYFAIQGLRNVAWELGFRVQDLKP